MTDKITNGDNNLDHINNNESLKAVRATRAPQAAQGSAWAGDGLCILTRRVLPLCRFS